MERPLNFHHLHYFRVIAEVMSIAEAAKILGLGASTLSEQLKAFEADLGVTLFDRRGKRLEITQEGRIVLEHARSIIAEGKDLRRRLKGLERRKEACFIISPDVPLEIISIVLNEARYAGIRNLKIERATSNNASLLRGRRFDAALFINPLTEPGLEGLTLAERPLFICEKKVAVKEAAKVYIIPPSESPRRGPVMEWIKRAGSEPSLIVEGQDQLYDIRIPDASLVFFSSMVPAEYKSIGVIDGYQEKVCLIRSVGHSDFTIKDFFNRFSQVRI